MASASAQDPFVASSLRELRKKIASGKVRIDDDLPRDPERWWTNPVVPRVLLPFFETLDLSVLVALVAQDRRLFWHPVVVQAVGYLQRLQFDETEWKRLGWAWDPDPDDWAPPDEVDTVRRRLQELVEAVAEGLLPGMRISWKAARKKPGRKSWIENPHPMAAMWTRRIDATRLYRDWSALKKGIEFNDKSGLLRPAFQRDGPT